MLYKEFYSELGKLLYAVADIDGVITQQEKRELQQIVKKELVPLDKHTDEFGTDAAYYAEIEFDFNDEQITDVDSAFNSFINFIEDHATAFDDKMKQVCVHVVKEIAAAYMGTNNKETAIIKTLREKLKRIEVKKSNSHSTEKGVDALFSAEPAFNYLDEENAESVNEINPLIDIIEEHEQNFDEKVIKMSEKIKKEIMKNKN